VENLSNLAGDGTPDLPPDCVTRVREDWRTARAAHGDLQRMGMPRVNLLLIGPDGPIQGFLELLEKSCTHPLIEWRRGERFALPPASRVRTVVLHDISNLDDHEQQSLLDWLENAQGVAQVISTSPVSLLPRVETGSFLDTLYYRLNMIVIDLVS
jgi:hypothetical protein